MPTISDAALARIVLALVILAGVGLFAGHLYNAGKGTQARKDQPVVTKAVTSEVASRVASGVSLGASQSNTTRLTKAEGTRKVTSAAEEALKHVLQQLPPPEPTGAPAVDTPQAALAGDSGLGVPNSVADAYLDGLKRVRESGTTGPQAFHQCPGIPGAWLICS